MSLIPYTMGAIASVAIFFIAYTMGMYRSEVTFYSAAIASSYFVFSTVAFLVTRFGRTKQRKAWIFFSCGILMLFAYVPSLRQLLEILYLDRLPFELQAVRQVFMFAHMFVSALCVFKAMSIWSELSLERGLAHNLAAGSPERVEPSHKA